MRKLYRYIKKSIGNLVYWFPIIWQDRDLDLFVILRHKLDSMAKISDGEDSKEDWNKGINNLIYWFPIIWQDRDWEHYYLSAILRHKLDSMAKFYDGDDAWNVDAQKLAQQMKFCVLILDRMLEDDYNRGEYDEHDKKWGELEFITNEKGMITMTRANRSMNEDLEQEEYKRVSENEMKNRDADIATLFKIMNENLLCWWD